jgi:hypothetical protein
MQFRVLYLQCGTAENIGDAEGTAPEEIMIMSPHIDQLTYFMYRPERDEEEEIELDGYRYKCYATYPGILDIPGGILFRKPDIDGRPYTDQPYKGRQEDALGRNAVDPGGQYLILKIKGLMGQVLFPEQVQIIYTEPFQ